MEKKAEVNGNDEEERENALLWLKSHQKELWIGALSSLLLISVGRNSRLNRQNILLMEWAKSKSEENASLFNMLQSCKTDYYSLAGEATRLGSSLGGHILSDARYSRFS